MSASVTRSGSAERRPEAPAQTTGSGRFPVFLPDPLDAYIPPAQWSIFQSVMQAAERAGVAYAVGGGMAIAFYSGVWRTTKDIDFYVTPANAGAMVEATRAAGMTDYYERNPYDRTWIYRAERDGVIVDVIRALANGSGEVDDAWLLRAPQTVLAGQRLRVLAPAEMIWTKLHVLQRDRCDWPDLFNLLYAAGPQMDWGRLIDGLLGEERLLASLLLAFSWVAPGRAHQLPAWIWARLQIDPPAECAPVHSELRIGRLDTRPWFAAAAPT